MECHMDVDMFLDGYAGWEVGSPHCPIILHKMFLYTAEQGWKEVEWMVCWGCQQGLPKLDPQADVSAIWLVGPQTSKDEFRALYYEVYKIRRLQGSPPWGLEWMEELATEIVSSLKDCLGWKGSKPLWGIEEPGLADVQSPRSKTPRRGRRDASAKRDLTKAREAHQRALATTAALEEKIETELVCHPRPARHPCPLLESGSPQKKILGTKQEALQGAARGEPCPFLWIQPSLVGPRIWGKQRGQTTSPGFWPGISTGVRTRGWPFPPGVSWQLRGRWQEQVLPRTPSGRVWKMGDLKSMGAWYAWLVARASQGPWGGWPPGAGPEGVGLLQTSPAD